MTHDEARERLSLVQGVLEEIAEKVTDTQLAVSVDEASENVNSAVARIDQMLTGHTTDLQKEPQPL